MTIRTLTIAAVLLTCVGASPQQRSYTVRKGDTLTKISKLLGVNPDKLAESNALTPNHILRPGAILVVPNSSPSIEIVSNPQAVPVAEEVELLADRITGAKTIGTLPKGATAVVLREGEDWTKLELPSGEVGWVPSNLLNISKPQILNVAPPEALATAVKPAPKKPVVSKVRAVSITSLVARAETYKGVRYRYGGTSRSGLDCSGFTTTVFRAEGIALPRTALQQSQVGQRVAKDELQAGDLVFFRTRGRVRVSHVGIYVGAGKFLHAPSTGGRVRQDALADGYYAKRYAGARRVLNGKSSLGSKDKSAE